jgi:hypothetical protein
MLVINCSSLISYFIRSLRPCKTLFISNVTPDNLILAENLFQSAPGFKKLVLASTKTYAFGEFDSIANATDAISQLDKYQLTPSTMLRMNFAKKDIEDRSSSTTSPLLSSSMPIL